MAGRRRLRYLFLVCGTALLCQAQAVSSNYDLKFGRDTLNRLGQYLESESTISSGGGYITSDKPFFLSVPIAEGNYKVSVTLGDRKGTSTTTIKAELRRLMVEHLETKTGEIATRGFIVNVRRPQIGHTGEVVTFKERERTTETRAWDERLTLQFSDTAPKVREVRIDRIENIPTVYIAGDSTSTDQSAEPYNSWGQMITRFFKPDIAVANNGESGETLRSFRREKRWAKVMSLIRPGDYVLIQFGHNDQKEKGEGVGPLTTYKADLKAFVAETRQHRATPIVITPMNRRTFDSSGKITNSLGDFPLAVRQVAKEDHVTLIDLNAMSKLLYEAFGPEGSGVLFAKGDGTHHSDFGSYELAKCVVEGIRESGSPLARFLINGLPRLDPAHPDSFEKFDIPADPAATTVKPYGQ